MSSLSKFFILISGFCLILMASVRLVLGGWHPFLYGFLALFVLGLVLSVILDYKLYLEFLSMKTAKKGLSFGWSLVVLIVFLIAIAYLGNRFNKSLDLTEEGLNSLSEQTVDILKSLDSELQFLIFYKGDKISPQALALKKELKSDLQLYKQSNSKARAFFIDTYKNNLKAKEYLSDLPDKNRQELFVFVNYKNRKVRVDEPFMEESLTSAIIKASKREFKDILFLTGHGERDLNEEGPEGLQILKQSLTDSGFNLKEWNFVQQGAPSKKPSLVIILGPNQDLLEPEKAWLTEYLNRGGKLFLSLDPQENQGIQNWLKNYGVQFQNNFIFSEQDILISRVTTPIVYGVEFDTENSITKRFVGKRKVVLFNKPSALDFDSSALENFKVSYLIKSHNNSFAVKELTQKIKRTGALNSFNLAIEVQPKAVESTTSENEEKEDTNPKEEDSFRLVVFGDSDFLTNKYISEGANRDLILNSFVSLAGEEELISIRPKQPKGTKVTLNQMQRTSLILLYLCLPVISLFIGVWFLYRRRNA